MKIFIFAKTAFLIIIVFFTVNLPAQRPVGTWKPYLAYHNAELAAETPNKVFAVYDGSLLSYSKDDDEVKLYSKNDGLNDVGINHIGYNSEAKVLVLTYSNANIDIITNDHIDNIASIKNDASMQTKDINNLEFNGSNAYISTSFGIVVVDLKRKEIKETYTLDKACYSTCIFGNYIYAATEEGVYRGLLSSNLLDKQNWNYYPLDYPGKPIDIRKVLVFNGKFVFFQLDNGVYYLDDNEKVNLLKSGKHRQIEVIKNQLILVNASSITFYSDFTNNTVLNGINTNYISSINNDNIYWLAQGTAGLSGIKKENNSSDYTVFHSGITVNSPKRNLAYKLIYSQKKLLVVGGSAGAVETNVPGTLMVLENGKWFNFDENKISKQIQQITGDTTLQCKNFLNVVVDPQDPNHYFVSSWGEGLYEFKDNELITLFNHKNSSLQTIYPSSSYPVQLRYVRVNGLAFDPKFNLYVLNAKISNAISIYSANKQWSNYSNNGVYHDINNHEFLEELLITRNNQKWINMPRPDGQTGIFVFDDKGTIDNTSDDQSVFSKVFTDDNGNQIGSSFNCMAEDLSGNVWVGTNGGPFVFSKTNDITKALSNYSRLKIPKNDGTNFVDYLLEGQTINAIAVDGGNRKWIGTESSGIFLVSSSGDKVLENFTAENSMLIDNKIVSMAINNETGEVFIGTEKGLISYMGDAITGKPDYSDVYAFPNPVRPESDGKVIVTGLIENSNVKITDLNGNLMTQGTSIGGQFSWDCKNRTGRIVSSGIYLVLASTPTDNTTSKSESVVSKIMVVR